MKQESIDYNNTNEKYNGDFSTLNCLVMHHTYQECKTDNNLKDFVGATKAGQFIVFEKDQLNIPKDGPTTNIVVSKKRSFEAAKSYFFQKKSVAVLNFANNHSVGGSPFSAGAQEESLCRTSTLFPCLEKEQKTYYEYHQKMYAQRLIGSDGNDDLIYSPQVVVFKTDESAPRMMEKNDWYFVDVITCAAPVLYKKPADLNDYENNIILPRLRKVFEVAKKQNIDVLILGAWGCGAFHNPPERIAKFFNTLCSEYHFDTIEFAIDASRKPCTNYDTFLKVFSE